MAKFSGSRIQETGAAGLLLACFPRLSERSEALMLNWENSEMVFSVRKYVWPPAYLNNSFNDRLACSPDAIWFSDNTSSISLWLGKHRFSISTERKDVRFRILILKDGLEKSKYSTRVSIWDSVSFRKLWSGRLATELTHSWDWRRDSLQLTSHSIDLEVVGAECLNQGDWS